MCVYQRIHTCIWTMYVIVCIVYVEWTYERRPGSRERNLHYSPFFLIDSLATSCMCIKHSHLPYLSSISSYPLISTSLNLISPSLHATSNLLICFLFTVALTEFTQGNLWGHECGAIHNFMGKSPLSQSLRRMTSSPAWPLTTIWSLEEVRGLWFLSCQWLFSFQTIQTRNGQLQLLEIHSCHDHAMPSRHFIDLSPLSKS